MNTMTHRFKASFAIALLLAAAFALLAGVTGIFWSTAGSAALMLPAIGVIFVMALVLTFALTMFE